MEQKEKKIPVLHDLAGPQHEDTTLGGTPSDKFILSQKEASDKYKI